MLTIYKMKQQGMNDYEVQALILTLWTAAGRDINLWVNSMEKGGYGEAHKFRVYWDSIKVKPETWLSRFIKKYICG